MAIRGVYAEVDLGAVRRNIRAIRTKVSNGAKFCAVVKADAYGHGAAAVARVAVEEGADYLAVAVVSEGIELRKAGITTPILVLGPSLPSEADDVVAYGLTQAVFHAEAVAALSTAAVNQKKIVKLHLAIDTGMGRIGVRPEDAGLVAAAIAELPGVELEGMFSHFALADAVDKSYAKIQLDRFNMAIEMTRQAGVNIAIKHIANSAAILEMPETHFDMVRAGIILYGLQPSDEIANTIGLEPALALKARLTYVKSYPAGETVSYGRTWTAQRPSRIATIPVGYADGYTRMYSGKAQILCDGKRAPIVGRICMDQCMADVTDIPGVKVGDEVILFGTPSLTTDEAASWLGTINYEVVSMLSPRIPRIYHE